MLPRTFRYPNLNPAVPALALAPMQDVTDLPFWKVMATYGGPDLYFTEFFRVHATSNLEPWIVEAVEGNSTGRPAIAQMIGNDVDALVRTAHELQQLPIAGIDLNLGCPAPIVYRKCAGGGLLREPNRIDSILGHLREAVSVPLSVKTRIGFENPDGFPTLLGLFRKHGVDLVTVHARTVSQMYRDPVHYDFVREAVDALPCPVIANGNIDSPARAAEVLRSTGAHGLMIGRGAIRNPWLFSQIRELWNGQEPTLPSGRDVLHYLRYLYDAVRPPGIRESAQVQKMKKYLNFIGVGINQPDAFLHEMRRTESEAGLFELFERFLNHDRPMDLIPIPTATPPALTPAA